MDWQENDSFDLLGDFELQSHTGAIKRSEITDLLSFPLPLQSSSEDTSSYQLSPLLPDHTFDSLPFESSSSTSDILSVEDSEIALEWLSDFGKNSTVSAAQVAEQKKHDRTEQQREEEQQEQKNQKSFALPFCGAVPCRARSKRSRRAKLSSDPSSSLSQPILLPPPPSSSIIRDISEEALQEALLGRRNNKGKAKTGTGSHSQPRRCTHCQSQKTPQWRMGPLGPKSLCNACGVRFKTGRLYPEYRPAKSPTFISLLHSNSHRRVLELRSGFFPFRLVPNNSLPPAKPNSVRSPDKSSRQF